MTDSTYLIDADAIKRNLIINPEFSQYLRAWHDAGSPDDWHSFDTSGGHYDAPFCLR